MIDEELLKKLHHILLEVSSSCDIARETLPFCGLNFIRLLVISTDSRRTRIHGVSQLLTQLCDPERHPKYGT